MISIVAKFTVSEGQEEKFIALVNKLAISSREEEGCIEYVLHRKLNNAQTFCILEKWKDQDAIDKHNNTAHFTIFVPQLTEIARADVELYEPV